MTKLTKQVLQYFRELLWHPGYAVPLYKEEMDVKDEDSGSPPPTGTTASIYNMNPQELKDLWERHAVGTSLPGAQPQVPEGTAPGDAFHSTFLAHLSNYRPIKGGHRPRQQPY